MRLNFEKGNRRSIKVAYYRKSQDVFGELTDGEDCRVQNREEESLKQIDDMLSQGIARNLHLVNSVVVIYFESSTCEQR